MLTQEIRVKYRSFVLNELKEEVATKLIINALVEKGVSPEMAKSLIVELARENYPKQRLMVLIVLFLGFILCGIFVAWFIFIQEISIISFMPLASGIALLTRYGKENSKTNYLSGILSDPIQEL